MNKYNFKAKNKTKPGRDISGWVILNKPYLMTSTQAVSKIKYLFGAKKAGHAGTLDPLATGMLPIALGHATKTVPYVMEGNKTYHFRINWGEQRDTDDLEGEIIKKSNLRPSKQQILDILPKYRGTILQIPPKYSALKIDGNRAYDLSRQGKEVELQPREIEIYKLELSEICENNNWAEFIIECSKGTYIRSLARDMGQDMQCLGYISKLSRALVQPFTDKNMLELSMLEQISPRQEGLKLSEIKPEEFNEIDKYLLPTAASLKHLNCYEIEAGQIGPISHGNSILLRFEQNALDSDTACILYKNKLLAIGHISQSIFYPNKVFN